MKTLMDCRRRLLIGNGVYLQIHQDEQASGTLSGTLEYLFFSTWKLPEATPGIFLPNSPFLFLQ
ncbi:hypothetical protein [Nitrosomonas sp.]|uniref:hypothetical protein n=1 Tax=Nitrosomonas sp. TaxID=42353 RepID=UPI0037C88994